MVQAGVVGQGSIEKTLSESEVRGLLREAFSGKEVKNKRLLVIIPDGTRSAPLPLMFRSLYEEFGERVQRLDYLIALGTHQPLSRSGYRSNSWVFRKRSARRKVPQVRSLQPPLGLGRIL